MTGYEFLRKETFGNVTKLASDWALGKLEQAYDEGKVYDFDSLFEGFEMVLNDAMIVGIEDGMERWNHERPKTEQEIADERADEWYTAHKEGCV